MSKEKKPNYTLRKAVAIVIVIAVIVGIVMLITKNGSNQKNAANALYKTADDGSKMNTSKALEQEKNIDGLTLTNIRLTYQDNVSYLKADVVNTTDEETGDFNITIKMLDKDGQTIITMIGYIPFVEAKGSTTLDTAITTDIAGAYDFEITKYGEESVEEPQEGPVEEPVEE